MSTESVHSDVAEVVSEAASAAASASAAPLAERATLDAQRAELIRERDELREARDQLAKAQSQLDQDRAALSEAERKSRAEPATQPLRLTRGAAMAPLSNTNNNSRATPDLVQLAREARETGDKTALVHYLRARRA